MTRSFLTIFFLLLSMISIGQVRVHGYVRDMATQELLIGASILNSENKNGTSSNLEGYFSLVANVGDKLRFSYIGYGDTTIVISNKNFTFLNISLRQGYELDAVTITSVRDQGFNVVRFSPIEIALMPSLGSKPDVLKSLQALPGISTQNEGAGTLVVRGGDPGQNLFLLDKVPLIYVYHLGGFMSVFNPDMINGIELYKAGFPAKFGGKLSSIVDISQRDGNMTERKGNVSVGITDLSFALEGPMRQLKNTSYIITGRKTLIEPLMILASSLSGGNEYITYYGFHDINAKLTVRKSQQSTFNFNAYYGDDYLLFRSTGKEKGKYSDVWGNWLISSRWKYLFKSGLSSSNLLSFNNYRLKESIEQKQKDEATQYSNYKSNVKNLMFRSDWNLGIIDAWKVSYGLQSNVWNYKPNSFETNVGESFTENSTSSIETALYLTNKIELGKYLGFNIGARLTNYGSDAYNTTNFEPRMQVFLKPHPTQVFNASYMEVNQSSHLLFTPGEIMQKEVWLTSGQDVPLSFSKQITIGWKGFFLQDKFNVEVDLYRKRMSGLVEFKEGYAFMPGDMGWRKKVETDGKGYSEGVEFLVRKRQGRLTGFAGYSYSKTTRTFPNINKGKEYLYEYDRPHNISLSLRYEINEKVNLNALWVYQTGLPYTPAIARQLTTEIRNDEPIYYEALVYGDRNSDRIRNYHRLDLGLNYETRSKRGNKVVWTFSLYNAYARQNPHHYYYNTNPSGEIFHPERGYDIGALKQYQMSYFPFIPSVSYKIYFDADHPLRKKPIKDRKLTRWMYAKEKPNADN